MTGCAAPGCKNTSTKGFLLKRFPMDPKRREIWAAAIQRPNLKPKTWSALCEVHFAPDAWEKVRADGTRKLKISAVPTLSIQAVHNKQQDHSTNPKIVPDPAVPSNFETVEIQKSTDVTINSTSSHAIIQDSTKHSERLKQKMPLPIFRPLYPRLHVNCTSGIHEEIFNLLKNKFSSVEHEHQKECALVFDKMSITPGRVHDVSSDQYIGNVTLPGHDSVIASHALVFMLTGITVRWKQIVAFYFTGDSINGADLKPIILDALEKAEVNGLRVTAIICDMGSVNQALWASFNINASRNSGVRNYIQHPIDRTRKLYFLADAPDLLVNLKTDLINDKIIWLSKSTQEKYNLPTNTVQIKHLDNLINEQSNLTFLLSPKLKKEHLDSTSQYAKMKVNIAKNMFSRNVSTSLQLMAKLNKEDTFLTTAWFIEKISDWYSLMSCRHPTFALSKHNVQKYNEATGILNEVMDIFRDLQIGNKLSWKPLQTGILITTNSILHLAEYFLQQQALPFLLTSRLTQDCMKNLFSAIQAKQPMPNAFQLQQNLRFVSESQLMKDI